MNASDTHPLDAWWAGHVHHQHVDVTPDPAWPYEPEAHS